MEFCIPEFYVMSLQRIKNGKIDWNWILKELIRNCRNIGREIVIVCVMVIVEIFWDLGNRSGENERIWDTS